jgi:hypothetical protein
MFCASAGIAIVPAAENAAVPADTPAVAAVAAPAPTMTAAEIVNTAIVESMDTSRHFFDEWCLYLAGIVGEEVMNEMNAAPEMYNAHFADFCSRFLARHGRHLPRRGGHLPRRPQQQ